MKTEMKTGPTPPPPGVSLRLAAMRALCQPEAVDAARVRLGAERPAANESFARAVARRLNVLRDLCALAQHLHQPK